MNRHKLLQCWSGTIMLVLLLVGCSNQAFRSDTVVIYVSDEQMAVIESLPDDVVCFTSASDPIESLEGLGDDEFASWVTSPVISQKLMAAFGREDTPIGLQLTGTGHEDADFIKNPKLRLFITHEPYAQDLLNHGGARIEFKTR